MHGWQLFLALNKIIEGFAFLSLPLSYRINTGFSSTSGQVISPLVSIEVFL